MVDVRWFFIAVVILGLPLVAPGGPMLDGRATWYGEPYIGRAMRNERIYTGQGMTCAVDDALWPALAGKWLMVCDADNCVRVLATDTGYLADWGVVVDLSPRAFGDLVGPLGVGVADVRAWVVGDGGD